MREQEAEQRESRNGGEEGEPGEHKVGRHSLIGEDGARADDQISKDDIGEGLKAKEQSDEGPKDTLVGDNDLQHDSQIDPHDSQNNVPVTVRMDAKLAPPERESIDIPEAIHHDAEWRS